MTGLNDEVPPTSEVGGTPADEVMTPAELRVVIGWLGLTQRDVAALCDVSERAVRRWLAGDRSIPDGVRLRIEQIEAYTTEQVGRYVNALQDSTGWPGVITYRDDHDLWAASPGLHPLPASWHRQVCARVAHDIAGLSIVYADDAPEQNGRNGQAR